MSVFKRYRGKRITQSDPNWHKARWWMEFRLCGQYVLESIVGARTTAQVFDDQVMDWIVEALHQSHADEKHFREDASYLAPHTGQSSQLVLTPTPEVLNFFARVAATA